MISKKCIAQNYDLFSFVILFLLFIFYLFIILYLFFIFLYYIIFIYLYFILIISFCRVSFYSEIIVRILRLSEQTLTTPRSRIWPEMYAQISVDARGMVWRVTAVRWRTSFTLFTCCFSFRRALSWLAFPH